MIGSITFWYSMRNCYGGMIGKLYQVRSGTDLLVLHEELRGTLDVDEERVDSLDVFDLHLHPTASPRHPSVLESISRCY